MLLPDRSAFPRICLRPHLIILPHDQRNSVSELTLNIAQFPIIQFGNITQGTAVHELLQGVQHIRSQRTCRNQSIQIYVGA